MTTTTLPTRTSLLERFAPVFERIAAGAVEREQSRSLPHEAVRWLADSGFTAVTVPTSSGGAGASATDLFALLIRLAEADSNIPQLLRAHFAFVEELLLEPDVVRRDEWFTRIAAGEVFGNASHERSTAAVGSLSTHIVPDGDGWRLHGEKHYSTGTIFADWTTVSARTPDGHTVGVTVRVDDPGVEVRDDWNGFGQRLTGSGTTRFDGVRVELWQLRPERAERRTVLPAFLQTVLLASLAGVGAVAARDAASFVRSRTRHYQHGVGATAATDPLVQSVVGRIASDAIAAEALVLDAAAAIDAAHGAIESGDDGADALIDAAELRTIALQGVVVEIVLRAATTLFEVGGASATDRDRSLDRHWRNARTLSSHNPVVFQQRVIGDHLVNGSPLTYFWATGETG
ncbi:alkylation response protein AidB-like acyl-CoA dehydrogenase [Curtobacterium sp. PhB191]|uniref:acyl-CoA dehydrogenase family protein n=1 Tax=Curtobacterium sp. PhB191 TaxID=2485202 RepID=UPI001042EDFA|nr:acyl-CoA dehydrogenase family protein [Curtobacterium sp. PhB191]TCU84021.1 alkylation response protein AidB-like acyl-CoA dehydrogenase [Curtobacterium sp. PhB191]